MESLLQSIPKVCVYIDYVLITGTTEQEHLANLTEVLCCMSDAGMRLKKDKCQFMLTHVNYLGHSVSREGIQPTNEKVRAIRDAPEPKNLQQLRAFIGLLNFYAKFLPNLSTVLAPLYSLLQKDRHWSWGPQQQRAFQKLSQCSPMIHFSLITAIQLNYCLPPMHRPMDWEPCFPTDSTMGQKSPWLTPQGRYRRLKRITPN